MARKIVVLGEVRDGSLRNVSFEALAAAKVVAEGGEVVGVLIGESVSVLGNEFIQYGADRIVSVENSKLAQYTSDGYAQALLAVMQDVKPDGMIMGHTALGKDLAPKLCAKLDAGLISDVIAIEEVGGNILFTRPIYSGKAFEKIIITDGLTFATIRSNNIPSLEKDESRTGDVSSLQVDIKDLRRLLKKSFGKPVEGWIFQKQKSLSLVDVV